MNEKFPLAGWSENLGPHYWVSGYVKYSGYMMA